MRRTALTTSALCLALALAGCGGGDDETTSSEDVETTASQSEATGSSGGDRDYGTGGDDAESDDSGETGDDGDVESDGSSAAGAISLMGADDVSYSTTEVSAEAGTVEVTLECGESIPHTFAIEGVDGGADVTSCEGGGDGTGTVELEAGEYTFFCNIGSHRSSGMEGTLTVG